MRFGLDYDHTFDQDPEFFMAFIDLAEKHGHEVRIVSARPLMAYGYKDVVDAIGGRIQCHFTDLAQKAPFMDNIGLHVDVWIDDNPEFIPAKTEFPL